MKVIYFLVLHLLRKMLRALCCQMQLIKNSGLKNITHNKFCYSFLFSTRIMMFLFEDTVQVKEDVFSPLHIEQTCFF